MVDRLIGVGRECAGRKVELPVEADAGTEGEDARADACEYPFRCAPAVAFEQELVFERVDDRLDPLPDPADRRLWAVGLVGAARAQKPVAELAYGLLELGAGEALVADDELALVRLPLEQDERRFPLGQVGGDEVEVAHGAVRAAEQ